MGVHGGAQAREENKVEEGHEGRVSTALVYPGEALTVSMTHERRPKEPKKKCSYLEEGSWEEREQPVQRP